jgi:hypothetical protein
MTFYREDVRRHAEEVEPFTFGGSDRDDSLESPVFLMGCRVPGGGEPISASVREGDMTGTPASDSGRRFPALSWWCPSR